MLKVKCQLNSCNNYVANPKRNKFCSKKCSMLYAKKISLEKTKKRTEARLIKLFKEQNITLISGSYVDNFSKNLEIKCNCGNIETINWQFFKNKIYTHKKFYCSKCIKSKKYKSRNKYSYKDLLQLVKDNNCSLVSKELDYDKVLTKNIYIFKCNCGNIFRKELSSFIKKPYCSNCGRIKAGKKYSYKQVQEIFKKENCELISITYKNMKGLLEYKCKCGNLRKDTLERFIRKKQCNLCNKKTSILKDPGFIQKNIEIKRRNGSLNTSKIETDLLTFLKKYYSDIKSNYKDKLRYPFYCDYYIPSLDIFIELNYHHSHGNSPFNKYNLYHLGLINNWQEKANKIKQYKNMINVFIKKDPKKLNYAIDNKLKYIQVYSLQSFYDLLYEIKDIVLNSANNIRTLLKEDIKNIDLSYNVSNSILEKELKRYKELNKSYNSNPSNNRIILKFQKSFYEKERNLWITNTRNRNRLITNRLKYLNKSSYKELTTNEILRGYKISGIYKGYSHFSPFWIKTFIKEYNIKSILDFCGGWGHRYLGSLDIEYIYNDTDIIKVNALKDIHNFTLNYYKNLPDKLFLNEDCSTFNFKKLYSYDTVFTCPPYFNTEVYNGEKDSYKQYSEYTLWLNIWWRNSIKNCIQKDLRYFAFVIDSKNKDQMLKICLEEGLCLDKEIAVGTNQTNHFHKRNKRKNKEALIICKNP